MDDVTHSKKTARRSDSLSQFLYQRIIRPILFTSRLGRRSMMGYADTSTNFDYIYHNKASGYTWVGTLVDRILLSLPACKATRQRKVALSAILRKEIEKNRAANRKTRIADLASGSAPYILDLVDREFCTDCEVLCLDLDRRSVNRGKASAFGLPILFKRANALKLRRLKFLSQRRSWRPNIIVVSGLYEYLEDGLVEDSLAQLFLHLDQGGLLVFFCQQSNPSENLMKKLGRTSQGTPWVLHYRIPSVIETWLSTIGYSDIETSVDNWNMYVCTIARKPAIAGLSSSL